MKLALVGPFPPIRGGISQFNERAARALESRGHEILPNSFRSLYPAVLFPGSSQYEPGCRAPRSGIEPLKPWTWKAAPEGDGTMIAYWSPVQALALRVVSAQASRPVVGLVHNALPHEKLPGGRLLAKLFLSGCDGVITLSESVAEDVRSLGFDGPILTTPHPSYDQFGNARDRSEARIRLGLSEDADVLLFFGLVRRYKGLDVLLESMPSALNRRPKMTLVVAGEFYDDAEAYRSLARKLAIEASVRFEDRFIPNEDVADYFSAADVVVQPYRSATQSGVLGAAAHFEKPVVVSGVGGLAQDVQHFEAGLVVDPENPIALAEAMVEAFLPNVQSRLQEGARRLAAARGWSPFCDTLETILREVS